MGSAKFQHPLPVPASSWHVQNHSWAGPRAALSQTPESPWPHCNVPVCQPDPHHSWTGVGAITIECLSRTGTGPRAWLSGARNYWGSSLVLQIGMVASGALHPAVLPSTDWCWLLDWVQGRAVRMVKPLKREAVLSTLGDIPNPGGYSPENPALGDPG